MTGAVAVVGAGGAAGRAVCEALAAAGRPFAAVDLQAPSGLPDGGSSYACDVTDPDAVRALAATLREEHGGASALVHLVGGWRGAKGFTGNTDEDWEWLRTLLVDTLRHTTRAFHDDLVAAPAGRAVIVSATAAGKPTPGGANYATAKAAAETWMAALAASFAKLSGDPPTAAATVLVVKALVHDAMRAEQPEATFPGYTDVRDLAAAVLSVLDGDAAALNGARIDLTRP